MTPRSKVLVIGAGAMGSTYGGFIPAYLTGRAWTQTHIGVVLTVATVWAARTACGAAISTSLPATGDATEMARIAVGKAASMAAVTPAAACSADARDWAARDASAERAGSRRCREGQAGDGARRVPRPLPAGRRALAVR